MEFDSVDVKTALIEAKEQVERLRGIDTISANLAQERLRQVMAMVLTNPQQAYVLLTALTDFCKQVSTGRLTDQERD